MPDLKYQPGYYGAEILEYGLELDDDNVDLPVLCFKVKIDDFEPPAIVEQRAYGEYDGKPWVDFAKAVVESLGGTWENLHTFDPIGQRCRVVVKHNVKGARTYENVHIVIGKKRTSDQSKVDQALAKITGKPVGDALGF